MSDEMQAVRDDVAFLKSLASGDGTRLTREGALLLAIGAVFAPIDLIYWSLSAKVISLPGFLQHVPWIVGLALFFVCLFVISWKVPRAPGAAPRAINAASAGVGFGIGASVIALILGAMRSHQPHLVVGVFPIVLLTLYGAVWIVAYAVRRQLWLALVAAGCFAAVIALGAFMGQPEEWLVLSAGMALLVAAPGACLIRSSRKV